MRQRSRGAFLVVSSAAAIIFDAAPASGLRMMEPTSEPTVSADKGWRLPSHAPSLQEVHRTVPVPKSLSFWKKMLAFSGPGYLVAVGYMDPGNWATDLAGGSAFGYSLLTVILLSNLLAILLQALGARFGIVTGRACAQACG